MSLVRYPQVPPSPHTPQVLTIPPLCPQISPLHIDPHRRINHLLIPIQETPKPTAMSRRPSLPTPAPENVSNREYYHPSTTTDAADADIDFPTSRSESPSPPHPPQLPLSLSLSLSLLHILKKAMHALHQTYTHKRHTTVVGGGGPHDAPSDSTTTIKAAVQTQSTDLGSLVEAARYARSASPSPSPSLSPADILLGAELLDVVALSALEGEMRARDVGGRESVGALVELRGWREGARRGVCDEREEEEKLGDV